MSAVRLADAKPGDVLIDADCDEWTRTADGATFVPSWGGDVVVWSASEFDEAEENFGPFAMLREVPHG